MVTWDESTLGELLEFRNGLNKGKEFFGKGTPIVNYMDVYRHRGIRSEQLRGRVTLSAEEIKKFDVLKGDVFFTRTSETPEEIGYASVMLDEVNDCVFSGFVLRGRPITDKLDIEYCQYAFMSENIRKAIISGCTYTTRALTNGKQLSAIEIQLPEKTEQRRIAEVLTDTDSLIAALEKLIAKKRAIKQGTMQELLTGKRRLPGFTGEWVETTVGRCLTEIIGGGTPSRSDAEFWNGDIPWVTVKDFATFDSRSTQEYINSIGLCNSATHLIPKGTLIIATRMGLGQIVFYDVDVTINQDLKALVLNSSTDTKYFMFWFRSKKADIEALGTGSTVKGITLEQLREFPILLPLIIAEQTAIAEILSEMDAEIDALTAKLNKVRNIKQGMMSELLTGRIRLTEKSVVAEAESPHDVMIMAGVLYAIFDNYKIGRMRVQKCMYLLRRYRGESTEGFKKHVAGPYASYLRYDIEPIAEEKKYITTETNDKGTIFSIGENIQDALDYIAKWNKLDDMQWVKEKLKYETDDNLELLSTVDMAICDLIKANTHVSVATIKNLIASDKEWKGKLDRPLYSDDNIARAIREVQTLLQGEN